MDFQARFEKKPVGTERVGQGCNLSSFLFMCCTIWALVWKILALVSNISDRIIWIPSNVEQDMRLNQNTAERLKQLSSNRAGKAVIALLFATAASRSKSRMGLSSNRSIFDCLPLKTVFQLFSYWIVRCTIKPEFKFWKPSFAFHSPWTQGYCCCSSIETIEIVWDIMSWFWECTARYLTSSKSRVYYSLHRISLRPSHKGALARSLHKEHKESHWWSRGDPEDTIASFRRATSCWYSLLDIRRLWRANRAICNVSSTWYSFDSSLLPRWIPRHAESVNPTSVAAGSRQ